ncbi:DNA-binding protein [Xenorhabdus griffiniae]|nr:DNA-binding protein [Xenorhabdus griffiniae]MDC9603950.1 DNA-binding protein [Xenorhabdus griffiniae]
MQDTLVQFAYVSLKKYSEITQIPFVTCRAMVADGRIITRPKKRAKDMIEVNMIAMLMDAYNNSQKKLSNRGNKK